MKKTTLILSLIFSHLGFSQVITETVTSVGIGTTTPTSILDIHTTDNNTATGVVISQGTSSNNRNSGRLFFENLGEPNNSFTIVKIDDRLSFRGISQAGVSSGTEYFNIKNNGAVGIGISNPEHGKLHINGNGPSQGINLWTHSGEITSRIWINSQEKTFHITRGGNPVDGITINNDGLVGIGTTAPDAELAVKGNIHTNEVKVNLLGAVAPDYVFYKDYDLKTLTEVEDYITEKGHLPNIPSAEQMEEEGVKLKEMNLKLLEKIEELTLYTIDQEKRMNKIEKENKNLKHINSKLVELQKRLEKLESKK